MFVYIWPDYTWRYEDEYDVIIDMWKGDDFFQVKFPEDATYEEIDDFVEDMARADREYMNED